uniref:Nuclear pore protein n=1 Tax=Timspurckia oligopyrenoides TaxID=708627 RepID=A0A6T6MNC6_9RHOD
MRIADEILRGRLDLGEENDVKEHIGVVERFLEEMILLTRDYKVLATLRVNEKNEYEIEDGMLKTLLMDGGWSLKEFVQLRNQILNDSARVEYVRHENTERAIELFVLSENIESIATLICDSLSKCISSQNSSNHCHRMIRNAHRICLFLESRNDQNNEFTHVVRSIHALIGMIEFLNLYWKQRYSEAWKCMKSLDLLPLTESQLAVASDRLRKSSSYFVACVIHHIPLTLSCAIETGVKVLERAKSRDRVSISTREQIELDQIVIQTRVLLSFASVMKMDDEYPSFNPILVEARLKII